MESIQKNFTTEKQLPTSQKEYVLLEIKEFCEFNSSEYKNDGNKLLKLRSNSSEICSNLLSLETNKINYLCGKTIVAKWPEKLFLRAELYNGGNFEGYSLHQGRTIIGTDNAGQDVLQMFDNDYWMITFELKEEKVIVTHILNDKMLGKPNVFVFTPEKKIDGIKLRMMLFKAGQEILLNEKYPTINKIQQEKDAADLIKKQKAIALAEKKKQDEAAAQKNLDDQRAKAAAANKKQDDEAEASKLTKQKEFADLKAKEDAQNLSDAFDIKIQEEAKNTGDDLIIKPVADSKLVKELLDKCNASQYLVIFLENEITDIERIKKLSKDDLKEIGVKLGARNDIMAYVDELNQENKAGNDLLDATKQISKTEFGPSASQSKYGSNQY